MKPGIVAGLAVAFLVTGWAPASFLADYGNRHVAGLLRAAAGAATGAGTLYAIRVVGHAILRKEVMGLGDVKLMAMVGAFTGPLETFLVLFLGSLSGAVLGGVLVAVRTRGFVAIPATILEKDDGAKAKTAAGTPVPLRIRAPRRGPLAVELSRRRARARRRRAFARARVPARVGLAGRHGARPRDRARERGRGRRRRA